MRALIQRAQNANVTVNDRIIGEVEKGFVVFLGVTHDDTEADVDYLVQKIAHLRIFEDDEGKMNHSLIDIAGGILSISQFTLYGDTRKGRRPSFTNAAKPEFANDMYKTFNEKLQEKGIKVQTGEFGAMMNVSLTNVGPVTFMIDSKEK